MLQDFLSQEFVNLVAQRRPDAVPLTYGPAHWTYAELAQATAALAGGQGVPCFHDDMATELGHYLVADGGLHHHLAATGQLSTVVGPSSTPLDKLVDRAPLPDTQVGDLVVVFQLGAYGASASPQQFLAHPSCVEVLV